MPVSFHESDILSLIDEETSGGSPFAHDHRPPYALVGLEVRHSALVDAVRGIYRQLKDDGTLGGEQQSQRYGGLGGEVTRLTKEGYVLVGLSFRQGTYTDQLAVIWQRWTTTGPDTTDEDRSQELGGQGGTPREIRALPGHIAVGLHGRASDYVDRISLITARPEVA